MNIFEPIKSTACGCDGAPGAPALMPVCDAVSAALALAAPVTETEEVPLHAALGRCLAAPVLARANLPRFDNAAMDGYALRCADLPGGGDLPVIGSCTAGDAPVSLPPGTAMRIYTGAPIPRGADAVAMQENAVRNGDRVRFAVPPRAGSAIRKTGENRQLGEVMLSPGTRLEAHHLAICASAGAGTVTVRRRLRAALVVTGDELAPAGQELEDGAIWDANSPMLTAFCEQAGVSLVAATRFPDRREDLASALSALSGTVDLIVTSGGVSVGDRDHLGPALKDLGAKVAVCGVAIKPGKPVTVSRLGGSVILSLPGNPVAAFVTWQVLGRPLLDRLAGTDAGPVRRHVRASDPLRHKPGRCEYRPARIVGYDGAGMERIACADHVHSADLAALAQADGLILIPGDCEEVEAGDLLEFLPL